MAEETQKKPVAVEAPVAETVVTSAAPVKETAKETVAPPAHTPAPESEVKETAKETVAPAAQTPAPESEVKKVEKPAAPASAEEPAAAPPTEEAAEKKIGESPSFKEESYIASELPEHQRKALEELKKLVQEALNKHEFTAPPTPPAPCAAATEEEKKPAEETAAETEDKPAATGATSEETAVKTEKDISVEKTEEKKPAVPADEDKKEEKKPAAAAEEKEEKKPAAAPAVEEKKEEKKPAAATAVEEKKEEKKPVVEEKKEEKKPDVEEKKEKDVPITLSEVITKETTTTVTTDGTKTVEAISESTTTDPTSKTDEKPKEEEVVVEAPPPPPPEEVFLWGIPLLGDDRSDVILLKFLRARDFKVKETLAMIKKCVRWRKKFGVDSLLDEDLGNDYEKVVFTHGCDKQGRPVVYNVFGEFNDKDLYQLAFSDAEKQNKFLKWLVQFVERTVRKFEFSPEGMNSFVIVNDLKNSPGYVKRELHKIFGKYMMLLQDNYPEFVSKQVCINVSFWYLAYSWVYVNVLSPRSKSKFLFATSSKTPDTLFRYISPEQVPVQYGGHSRAGELEFTSEEPVTEITIKPSSSHPIEFTFTEPCALVWELRVLGWDVSYEAQFVPEDGYTVLVTKPKKMSPVNDDPVLCDSFKVSQPGKLVITIDNHSSKKKKLLYRSKVKTTTETATTTAQSPV